MALIHVTGDPRAGKTSLVVARTVTDDMQYFNWRYSSACAYIKSKNRVYGLTRALPPQRHVVSGNILIWTRFPSMTSYPMSGWEFGAPNKFVKTKAFIHYGVYIFDEAQRYFDSKGDAKELPPWVTQAFELHGQIFLKIFLITQRPVRLHKDIRAICSERIHVEKSVHTFIVNGHKVKTKEFLSVGRLVKTVWYGRQFTSAGEHEAYVDGANSDNKKLGKPYKYVFYGDIREHYDPYAYSTEMEDLDKDFNYVDYEITERPEEWTTYKKIMKKEGKKVENGEESG